MTGPGFAPVVIAIAVSAGLAAWLIMIYYAASHPRWKHQGPAGEQPAGDAAGQSGRPPAAVQPESGAQRPASDRPRTGPGRPDRSQVPRAA